MRPFLALCRKEFLSLFGAPTAYLTLTMVALVTAIVFFEHLRLYNQVLFVFASSNMGGFDTDAIPDYVNLWDSVFFPVMDTLGIMLLALIPLITMRVFAEERSNGTDELLLTTHLTPTQIVAAKFLVTFAFVALTLALSFVYPAAAIEQGGIGAEHLAAVFGGLLALGLGVASVGLVCSAFSSNQLVAAVTGWALAFVLWDFSWANAFLNEGVASFLEQIAMQPRYSAFAEGIVGLDNAAYFLALALVGMAVARFSFDLRRVGA
jgi:ABC-2 type transport system permease protein